MRSDTSQKADKRNVDFSRKHVIALNWSQEWLFDYQPASLALVHVALELEEEKTIE